MFIGFALASPPFLVLAGILLIVGTAGIAFLCWIWMRKSRASQARMEEADRVMIDLLREQNRLLRDLVERVDRPT